MPDFSDVQGLVNSISNLSNPFGPVSAAKWNIQRCLFQQLQGNKFGTNAATLKSVVMFYEVNGAKAASGQIAENYQSKTALEQIEDKGGRRLAIYEYPYQDGQAVADLGRKGEEFSLNLKFWGLQYQTRFQDFVENVAKYNGPGQIIHPIRGVFPVKFKEWDFIHKHDEWNSVTIKAIFIEDNSLILQQQNKGGSQQKPSVSIDQSIRNALSTLSTVRAAISSAISDVTALLRLPGAIKNAFQLTAKSLTDQIAGLQAQFAATFSTNAQLNQVNAQAAAVGSNLLNINSGTIPSNTTSSNQGITTTSVLPPVLQAGFDPSTSALLLEQITTFVNGSQVTTQQAIYAANQIRSGISQAIIDAEAQFGVYSFDIVFGYRQLAVMVQQLTEDCVSSVTPTIVQYTTPRAMSLRQIAFANNLTPEDQNAIANLNPFLPSINRVEKGTVVLVPST